MPVFGHEETPMRQGSAHTETEVPCHHFATISISSPEDRKSKMHHARTGALGARRGRLTRGPSQPFEVRPILTILHHNAMLTETRENYRHS